MSPDNTSADDPAAEPLGAQPGEADGPTSDDQSAVISPIMADPSWVFAAQTSEDGGTPAPRISILKLLTGSNDRTAKTEAVASQPDASQAAQDGLGKAAGSEEQVG